jgi:hypothetical protein
MLLGGAFVLDGWQAPAVEAGLQQIDHSGSKFPGLPENANPRPDGASLLRDSATREESTKRLKDINILRQKEMKAETARLVQLAHELSAETQKNSRDIFPMEEIRKAEQIEKLAKAVRETMKATVSLD